MAQILRISSLRRLACLQQVPIQSLNIDLTACRSCQRLQQGFGSACRPRQGFNILYRRSSSAKVEGRFIWSLPKHKDGDRGNTRTELVKVLQARMTQLQETHPEQNKSELFTTLPKVPRMEVPIRHKMNEDTWTNDLENFKQQMSKLKDTNLELTEIHTNIKDGQIIEATKKSYSGHKKKTKSIKSKKKKASKAKSAKTSVTDVEDTELGPLNQVTGLATGLGDVEDLEALDEAEHESEADVVREIRQVLTDNKTNDQVSQQLQGYMQKLIDSEKLTPDAISAPFWKPEELKNMTEVKNGLEVVEKLAQKMSQLQIHAVERELEKQAQRQNQLYNHEVHSYIDACLHSGLVRKAHAALMMKELNKKSVYRSRKDGQEFAITDVGAYNKVMAAWAKQGNIEHIKRLFKQMINTGVTPSLQSYTACLECFGRQNPIPTDMAQKVLDDIKESGFNIANILQECHFQKDEWDYVRKAILAVNPEFSGSTNHSQDQYTCELLAHLNESNSSPHVRSGNPHAGLTGSEHLRSQAQQQMKHEQKDFVTVSTILPHNNHIPKVQVARQKLQETRLMWKQCLKRAFKRDLVMEEKRKHNVSGLSTVPYLKLFPHNTYVNLMMQEIDTIALETESYSPSLSLLQRQFGVRVNRHYMVKDRIKSGYINKLSGAYLEYLDDYLSESRSHVTDRQCWQSFVDKHTEGVQIDTRQKLWPSSTTRMVGLWLYRLILMDIKIDANLFKDTDEREEIPAFYTVYRQEGPQVKEVIKPHPLLVRLYRSANVQSLTFDSSAMPSLTPPLPWNSITSGGSLLSTTNLVINPQRSQEQIGMLHALPNNQLNPVFDALNVLSSTPWSINKPILDLIISIFNQGGDPSLDIPQPSSSFPDPPKIAAWMSDEDKVAILRQRQEMRKEQQEMHSLWMTELYRLSIANHYRDEVFWFPHNLDFRSRVYATPPHFNHLGSDLARSILMFAEGKKLGPHGLDWLKTHLVNLTGFKKRSSNTERLQFANKMLPEILDSADNPMTGRMWWKTSDEPWQTLACCMEIAKVVRSPNPQEYICRYPVHQDGSCNGLQHYAALGRDQAGAESVNLFPFSSPKDVYSDVVDLVEEERCRDAAGGEEIAIALKGFIRRKVIKQTIMTTVYGVTRFGARLQIEGQLQDMPEFPQRKVFDASLYLTRKTFDCLQKMFTSTKEIQDWFTVCAKIASSIFYKPMEWETPLGWPVLQPYYRTYNPAALLKRPKVGHIEIANTKRQKNGFPPNFIHSLDSTHMMLTALLCQRAGVTFVSVHDCFWTHPADVAVMNKICRQEFVALHSQPILEDLADFMYTKYGYLPGMEESQQVDPITRDFINHVLQRVPERGTFDLRQVLASTYFFS